MTLFEKLYLRMLNMNYFGLQEMADRKVDAMLKCNKLGKPFIEHFKKSVNDTENKNYETLHHHCKEMQSWWNDIKNTTLKSNKKQITDTQLKDWFFSCGGIYKDYLSFDLVPKYELFIKELLKDRNKSIYDIFVYLF